MCCVGSSVAAAPAAATTGCHLSMEWFYWRPIQWTPTTTPTLEVRWSRAPRAGIANLSMRGERVVAEPVGAIWRAGAAILFPLVMGGYVAAFVRISGACAERAVAIPQRESRANRQLSQSCAACGRAIVCACHMLHVRARFALV